MTDIRKTVQALFKDDKRWEAFGNVLTSLTIRGFRSHSDTTVHFRSPVTAIAGANGTGKTTIVQLAALAYQAADERYASRYISDYFARGPLDPWPYKEDASFQMTYWQEDKRPRTITISRSKDRGGWSDYTARERRLAYFFGVDTFIPSCERRDFTFIKAEELAMKGETTLDNTIHEKISGLLNRNYTEVVRVRAGFRDDQTNLLTTKRDALRYSEANMGCGEGRIHKLVSVLEELPKRALVLLEEPEISLHQAVQYRLGWYLMDVAERRQHQVIVTTHSEPLLAALPPESRICLVWEGEKVASVPGLAGREVESLLSDGYKRALTVVVEDDVAQAVTVEIIRSEDRTFFHTVSVLPAGYKTASGHAGGGKDEVKAALRTLANSKIPLAAVLDPDVPVAGQPSSTVESAEREDRKAYIFKLPGSKPPEVEMANSQKLDAYVREVYGRPLAELIRNAGVSDHHDWLGKVARQLQKAREDLLGEFARVFVSELSPAARSALVGQLKEAARDQRRN